MYFFLPKYFLVKHPVCRIRVTITVIANVVNIYLYIRRPSYYGLGDVSRKCPYKADFVSLDRNYTFLNKTGL